MFNRERSENEMRKHLMVIAALAIAVGAVLFSAAAYALDDDDDALAGEFWSALSGAQEVPNVDSATGGRLRLQFSDDLSAAEYTLEIDDGMAVTEATLHCGRAGHVGPAKLFLYGPSAPSDVDGELSAGVLNNANFDFVSPDCEAFIGQRVNNIASLFFAAKEGLIYVNVDTAVNPKGEVRGQLLEGQPLPVADDGDDDDEDDDGDGDDSKDSED